MPTNLFDRAVANFEKRAGASANVTARIASTASGRETTTGWLTVTYTNSTEKMIIIPRGASYQFGRFGLHSIENAIGITDKTSDEWLGSVVSGQKDYRVVGHELLYWLNKYVATKLTLEELPFWSGASGGITWTKTRPKDPRERTKVYIDTYMRDAQITRDNDNTLAGWACIFSNPPYTLYQEFVDTAIFGLVTVDMPKSLPLIDCELSPYGYKESVPIHIITVDQANCTGTALNWKIEAELRYVCETYPEGSYRHIEYSANHDRNILGTDVYDREFVMMYERDNS